MRLTERLPWLRAHLAETQHRNAYYLMLSQALGAGTGVLFWLLFARVVSSETIGIGASIVLLGTAVGVVAKGGFDTAIVRSAPLAHSSQARRLARFAVLLCSLGAIAITLALAGVAGSMPAIPDPGAIGWLLVGGVAVLLVVTWLQDAFFLAAGDASFVFRRNAVLSAGRLVLPIPVVLLAVAHPVAAAWAMALAASAAAAGLAVRRVPGWDGQAIAATVFVRRAMRNIMGSAAEFLPGLLLVPLILILAGATAAGHFAIAWNAASLLFIASAAIGRSALSELARGAEGGFRAVIRRGGLQSLMLLAPAAAMGILFAPMFMGIFGAEYARESVAPFRILCASILFVAPTYLYLTVLRAQDRALPLLLFPFGMLAVIFVLVPVLEARMSLQGVALAWLGANVPFGLYALWRLIHHAREVRHEAGYAAHA